MAKPQFDIEIMAAPSILGLRPNGVALQAERLLAAGLDRQLALQYPVRHLPTLNHVYNPQRDPDTHCLNPQALHDFSISLAKAANAILDKGRFPLILGGDCSILLGIMAGLKTRGQYGLIFLDAHADFYEPEKSVTGEVADMDLAIVTGRGPAILTNIHDARPYVKDEHVIHIGQRDWEETKKYGSQDIRETVITRYDFAAIAQDGIAAVTAAVIGRLDNSLDGYWLHFDTDVLSDEVNPAVDYRLQGGLSFDEAAYCMHELLGTGRIAGLDVTCYNADLDPGHQIARNIAAAIARAFS